MAILNKPVFRLDTDDEGAAKRLWDHIAGSAAVMNDPKISIRLIVKAAAKKDAKAKKGT